MLILHWKPLHPFRQFHAHLVLDNSGTPSFIPQESAPYYTVCLFVLPGLGSMRSAVGSSGGTSSHSLDGALWRADYINHRAPPWTTTTISMRLCARYRWKFGQERAMARRFRSLFH